MVDWALVAALPHPGRGPGHATPLRAPHAVPETVAACRNDGDARHGSGDFGMYGCKGGVAVRGDR